MTRVSGAFWWEPGPQSLPTILDDQQFWTFAFDKRDETRVTVDAFCKNEAKHRIKHTSLVQQSANWVLLKYIARNTGIIWRKMRI